MSGNIHPYTNFGDNTIPPLQAAPVRVEDRKSVFLVPPPSVPVLRYSTCPSSVPTMSYTRTISRTQERGGGLSRLPGDIATQELTALLYESVPDYMLEIRQQPHHARVALGKDKADRKPIDPPPILQLKVSHKKDPMQNFLQSPYYFMSCSLIKGDESSGKDPLPSQLIGTVVSSLHRLKDTDNQDGAFFVFGDLSCKVEGKFRLLFTLYQMQKTECIHITSIISDVFQVYPTKSFPGLSESTFLTRSFSDQGVRLRLRKDSRSMTSRKRSATAAEFARKQQDQRDQQSRRVLVGRATMDSSFPYGGLVGGGAAGSGGGFETSAYGHYDTDIGLSKRRRLISDEIPTASHPYEAAGSSSGGPETDLSSYGVPRSSYASSQISLPVSSAGYGMSTMPTQTAATLTYSHAPPQRHLGRIDTQTLGGSPHGGPGSAASVAFQSSPNRPSPHAFSYGALQASPSSMTYPTSIATSTSIHALTGSPSGEYRPHAGPLYTNSTPTDASPRTHATPNAHQSTPSGTGTSPPDVATSNYTATASTMTPFSQSIGPYAYANALGDPQVHLPPPPPMTATRGHGHPALDLQHVNGSSLGLDINYAEVGRHHHGQA